MTLPRTVQRVAAFVVMAAVLGAGCNITAPAPSGASSAAPSTAANTAHSPDTGGSPDPVTDLIAAAEAEGNLTTIALAHEWCGYGEALKTFADRYEITINELNPDAGFGDELAAIKDNRTNKGPQAPDVIDVGFSFGPKAKTDGLLAPYKVSTWDTIPAAVKDPAGFWYGGYYGVLAFETNESTGAIPPTDWADLLDPSRTTPIALAGDPRVSTQAIETVFAASLASGGSLNNAKPGLDFFAKLKKAGKLSATIASPDTIDNGTTPITIRWTYNALAHRDLTAGDPRITVTVPTKGRLAGTDVQAISAFAPHPNAAKLWMEFLYSDEVQNIWLKANCVPARIADLTARDAIPPDVLANAIDTSGAVFPTLNQINRATSLITTKWNSVVGVDIK